MTPEALNNYAYVCLGMIICIVPFLVVAFFTYCVVVMGTLADRRKEKLLKKKYGKRNDGGYYK